MISRENPLRIKDGEEAGLGGKHGYAMFLSS